MNLISHYRRNPRLLARHLRFGLGQLTRPGGLYRIRAGLANQAARANEAGLDALALLAGIGQQQRRRPAEVMRRLTAHAGLGDGRRGSASELRALRRELLLQMALFDDAFYGDQYPDVTSDRLDHYVDHGVTEGRRPNPWFDPQAYVRAAPDIVATGFDPVLHYALLGWRDGLNAGVHFDPAHYTAQLSGPEALGDMSPFVHFLKIGRGAGLTPVDESAVLAASRKMPSRGTLLLVSHELRVGGAPALLRIIAEWLRDHTRFDIRFVAMDGGGLVEAFEAIAPTLVLSHLPPEDREEALARFAGDDVRAVVVNSVASGGFLRLWHADVPIVSYIHELPKILTMFRDELDLILARSTLLIGCSRAVTDSLRDDFGADPAKLGVQYGFIQPADPDLKKLAEDKPAAKRALGLDPSKRVISGCGTLHWRKSPDKFVEVAKRVLSTHPDVVFRWIGGGEDQAKCERMVRDAGLTGSIVFPGHFPNALPHLAASDIFILPSEEDPFPLACLEAGYMRNPVICFHGAGGSPELYADGAGQAVPFGDVDAMANAVRAYLDDPERLAAEGAEVQRRVERGHIVETACQSMLNHLRNAAGLPPEVSVIVPNYNYERFLPERLASIAGQTFQDFEVILLDDCSRDGSVALMAEWAEARPGTRLEANTVNSGSPFAQWLKGMALAKGKLIWIAEADDSARPDLLEGLVRAMCDRNVMLAYAKSVPVGADGAVLGDYGPIYLDRINPGRWDTSYVATDAEEVNGGLGIANCIPNASSVLFRAFTPEPDFAEALLAMRMCGDWFFYLRAIRGGLVAFDSAPANLHRRHDGTVTHATEGSLRYFDELAVVRAFIRRTYRLAPEVEARIAGFMASEIARFGVTDPARIAEIERSLTGPSERPPAVLVAVSDLGAGGGQLFAIRLTTALAERGCRVVLLECGTYPAHPRMRELVDSRVPLFTPTSPATLPELLGRFDIDVVQTSLWWADRFVARSTDALEDRVWVTSMHGCHETLLDDPSIDPEAPALFKVMKDRVDSFVYTAEKNRALFGKIGQPRVLRQIDNGVDARLGTPIPRARLGLREDALVLVLASRAIPDKGWAAAVEATARLNAAGVATDLLLIGEGPEADRIARRCPAHVHLIGQVSNLADYLATADVGLIPSSFIGESLPLVMLDMMAQGKPVLATDRGEIPRILDAEGDAPSGIVVPLRGGAVDVEGFVAALRHLADPELRARLGATARQRFETGFTAGQMAASYEGLYRELLEARAGG